MPGISASLPEVSGDVSAPSTGGIDFDVAVPSVGVDASAPSASVDLPGKCKAARVACFISLVRVLVSLFATPLAGKYSLL